MVYFDGAGSVPGRQGWAMKMTGARMAVLTRVAVHHAVFEHEACGPGIGRSLHEAGLVSRHPGTARGRLTTLVITAAGFAAVAKVLVCPCWTCAKERIADAKRAEGKAA